MPVRLTGGLVAMAAVAAAVVPGSLSGFTAKDTNTADNYASGSLVLSGTANASTCTTSTSTISTNANTNCAGTLFPPVVSSTTSASSITVANSGTLTASSVSLASASSCGVITTPDTSSAANNPTIVTGGVTTTTSTPLTGGSSLAFDGSTGYLQSEQSFANPQTYSLAAWFETPAGSTSGGTVIGASSLQGNQSTYNYDRMVWVDSSGHLDFGVYSGSSTGVITSSGTYNNGAWHFVVATATSTGTALYVDGASVGTSTSATSSQDYGAWWDIGWSPVANGGWSPNPNQGFFNGDIADVAVFPTVLTSAQVTSLNGAGSQSTESSRVLAISPTSYWPMQSTPTSTTGTMENLGTTFPDIGGGNNTATIQSQVTSYTSSKWSDGSSAEFEAPQSGYLQTSVSQANPQTFSIQAWFKTPAGGGGTIVGFTNAKADSGQSAADTDRAVWVDSAGKVVFGINDAGTQDEITSSSNYANNAWHLLVATFSSSTGMTLYVDGAKVVSNTADNAAASYTGYWHVGWGGEVAGSWADSPTSAYFDGEMTDVAIYSGTGGALTQAQVTSLNGATTQAAEQTAINTIDPTYDWALLTAQTVSFCASEQVSIAIENDQPTPVYCIDPYQTGACPAAGTSVAVSTIGGASIPLGNISPGGSDVIKISMSDTTNAYDGMHFAIPLTLSASAGGFTASLLYPATTPQQTFQG